MATFTDRLMGEVIENPEGQERDVELLLNRLLHCLVDEVKQHTATQGSTSHSFENSAKGEILGGDIK